jgi:hypothetical protein
VNPKRARVYDVTMATKERQPKNPRVPIFPPTVMPLVELLNQMIDAPELELDRRAMAYGLLTRLCVTWLPPVGRFTVNAELIDYHEDRPDEARCKLKGNPPLVDDIIRLMVALFPDGAGLPPQEGCGPL